MEIESAAAEPLAAAPVSAPSDADALVDLWFIETFHNQGFITTPQFNRLYAAKENLKERLSAMGKE
jgi:hypothetical protein